MMRGILLGICALALLGLDFILFPDFVEDRVALEGLSASSVANGDLVVMGKYHLHTIRVSSGTIADEKYLVRLGPRVNGLAMTAFSTAGADGVGIGAFATAVIPLLQPADGVKLKALIREDPSLAPGRVQVLELSKAPRRGSLPHIDYLFVLRAARGNDREARQALQEGLVEILRQGGDHKVSGLLLPTLTVPTSTTPAAQGSPTFDDFFRSLFAAMKESKSPQSIDVSFYEEWSTDELEHATGAFNAYWSTATRERSGFFAAIHRYQLRLLLIGLAVCFVVCGRRIRLDLRSTSIVAVGYVLMLLGAFKTIETVTEGLTRARGVLLLIVTIGLAIFFPSIVGWSARDLFAEMRQHVEG